MPNKKGNESKASYRRILLIDSILSCGGYHSSRELAEQVENVSVETIKRDIASLRDDYNAPVEYSKLHEGYFYTQKTYRLPAVFTDYNGLLATELVKQLMTGIRGTEVFDNANSILNDVSSPVENPFDRPERPDFNWVKNRIINLNDDTNMDTENGAWDKIALSLMRNTAISFKYKGKADERYIKRHVHPYQLLLFQNGWQLWCCDTDKKSNRIFNLNRMKDIEISSEHFKLPPGFDYRKISNGIFGAYSGDSVYDFRIQFWEEAVLPVREKIWGKNQRIEEQDDGSIILSFSGCQYEPVLTFVLSNGCTAKPLAPEKLVADWKRNVEAMSGMIQHG